MADAVLTLFELDALAEPQLPSDGIKIYIGCRVGLALACAGFVSKRLLSTGYAQATRSVRCQQQDVALT